jgi:hypothetical protein
VAPTAFWTGAQVRPTWLARAECWKGEVVKMRCKVSSQHPRRSRKCSERAGYQCQHQWLLCITGTIIAAFFTILSIVPRPYLHPLCFLFSQKRWAETCQPMEEEH